MKILHPVETDERRYTRFRREVETVSALAEAGRAVLPLIEFELPENLDEDGPAWFAMPVARNLRDALRSAQLVEIVRSVQELAHELAELAAEGTHHRDVKPENLYSHGGRYLLGDFGLVKRLTDEDLTRPEEHLPGPGHYLPNEAIMRWEDADPEAIDLVCLAKTLWVLLLREKRPTAGQLRAGGYYSLSRRLPDEPYMAELDSILERATSDDPDERGKLRRFADELRAWLEARELRRGLLTEAERDEEVVAMVRRWIVREARTDPSYGYRIVDVADENESPLQGVPPRELSDAIQRLFDQGGIAAERDEHPEPRYWFNLHPRSWLVDEVEGQDAARAELTPILRALAQDRLDVLQLNRDVEVVLGGVSYPAPLLAFAVRYWIESGFLEAREEPEGGGGLLFFNVRVTAPGHDFLRTLAEPASPEAAAAPKTVKRERAGASSGIGFSLFISNSRERFWKIRGQRLKDETPSRFMHGMVEIGYAIEPAGQFALPQLKELLTQAQQPMDWPLWAVHSDRDRAPVIRDGIVEAFIADPANPLPQYSDFWRASPRLVLYLTRGHYEDSLEKVQPGTALDLGEPIVLAGEALLHAHRLSQLAAVPGATVRLRIGWTGLRGRQLRVLMPRRRVLNERFAQEDQVEAEVHVTASEIRERLVELVKELTQPLYVSFDFFEPPHDLFEVELEPLRRPMPPY